MEFEEGAKGAAEREIGEEAVRARARKREQLRAKRKWRSTIWTMECSGVGAHIV